MPKLTKIRKDCPDGRSCPAVHSTDAGTLMIVGRHVTDSGDLSQMAIGDDEAAIEIPQSFLPEVTPLRTGEAALGEYIDTHATGSLFRMEVLATYEVGSDGGDYQRYMDGEPGPDAGRKAAWHKVLQADLDRGIRTRRVHVIRTPLSDYLRYEFEWGYAHNLAYEDIRIIDLTENPQAATLAETGDFWLMDRGAAAVLRYDSAGRYLGFTEAPAAQVPLYAIAADAAWLAGTPFTAWWEAHREFWRDGRQAA